MYKDFNIYHNCCEKNKMDEFIIRTNDMPVILCRSGKVNRNLKYKTEPLPIKVYSIKLVVQIRNIDLAFVEVNYIAKLNNNYPVNAIGGLLIPYFDKKTGKAVELNNIVNINPLK